MSHHLKDLYSLLQAAEQSEPIQAVPCHCPSHPASSPPFHHPPEDSSPHASHSTHSKTSHHSHASMAIDSKDSGSTPRISLNLDLPAPLSSNSTHSSSTGTPHPSQQLTSDNPIAPNAMALEMARLNYLQQLQQYQQWQLNLPPSAGSTAASDLVVPTSGRVSPSANAMDVSAPTTSSSMPSESMHLSAGLFPIPGSNGAYSSASLAAGRPVGPLATHFATTSTIAAPSITIPLPMAPGSESQREQLIRTLRELFPEVDASGTPEDVIALGRALRPLLCEMCGHEEPNKIQLTVHHKNHRHRSGSYKCDQPRCRFDGGSSFDNLVNHRQQQHHIRGFATTHHGSDVNPPSSSKASTPILPDETPDSKSPRKSYKCQDPECESTFQSYSGLKYHQLLHSGAKEHRCPWPGCSAAFTNSSGLKIHKMTHDPSSKAWKCSWDGCRAAFTTSSALSTHTRTHTGAKPYACTWSKCDKNFARADHLKIHLRSHTNERPYVCESCGKGFTNSSGLRTHEKTHKGFTSSSDPVLPQTP